MRYSLFFILISNLIWLPSALATLQFSETSYRVQENNNILTVTVKRTGNTDEKIGANYATKSGSAKAGNDFEVAKGLLTWTVGESRDKTFAITILEDFVMENNETFIVILRTKSGTLDTAKITIVDNDKTVGNSPFTVLLPPTTGHINIVHNYNEQTITDATIEANSSISNAILVGDISNQGLLSNITVSEETTLQGGKITGYITNQGTIANIEFVGARLTGGELAGTIIIQRYITKLGLGVLADIHLAKDAHIRGGILKGIIAGNAEGKALIEQAEIRAGAELSNVIIGKDCQIAEGVKIGESVHFIDND